MKKIVFLLFASCAILITACGNAEVDKINKLIIEATEKTMSVDSAQDVADIATTLQEEMDKIAAEAGSKISFGKDVNDALTKYQEAAAAKLAEFGIEMD